MEKNKSLYDIYAEGKIELQQTIELDYLDNKLLSDSLTDCDVTKAFVELENYLRTLCVFKRFLRNVVGISSDIIKHSTVVKTDSGFHILRPYALVLTDEQKKIFSIADSYYLHLSFDDAAKLPFFVEKI